MADTRTYARRWHAMRVKPGGTRPAPDRIITRGALAGMPMPVPEHRKGESKVERSLRDEGYECYLPRMKREIVHHRTKGKIVRSFPLFTGYIFVALASRSMDFRTLRELEFSGPIVKVGDVPIPLSDQIIASFQQAEAEMEFDDTEEARIKRGEQARTKKEELRRRFRKGSRVQVQDGPFGGFHGHVVSVKGRDRVAAMIEIFGREVPVEFEAEQLERVEVLRKSA